SDGVVRGRAPPLVARPGVRGHAARGCATAVAGRGLLERHPRGVPLDLPARHLRLRPPAHRHHHVPVLRAGADRAARQRRPARAILFIDVPREQKYKSKNFIDTVVYRGGDAVAAWISAGLRALGLGIVPAAAAAIVLSGVWLWNALVLARKDEALETPR